MKLSKQSINIFVCCVVDGVSNIQLVKQNWQYNLFITCKYIVYFFNLSLSFTLKREIALIVAEVGPLAYLAVALHP